jgi:hypothetical protein
VILIVENEPFFLGYGDYTDKESVIPMDTRTLFSQLEHNTGEFPDEILTEIIEKQDAVIPLLLEELQSVAADPKALLAKGLSYFRHLYAIYLLAQFRVAAAYPPLVEFVSTPGEIVMEILDDTVTEDLGRILASLCHGDLAPIKRLIEDSEVNEWVRSASLDALIVLYAEGELEREEIIGYLRELFSVKVERKPSYIWSSMVHIAYELYPEELMGDIKRAYREGLVESDDISLVDIERMMAWEKEKQLTDVRRHSRGLSVM